MSRDQKPRLGRGLASLIRRSATTADGDGDGQYVPSDADGSPAEPTAASDAPAADVAGIETATPHQPMTVPIASIRRNPYQPRRNFDEDSLKGLAESIRAHGLLQPVVLVEAGIVEGRH